MAGAAPAGPATAILGNDGYLASAEVGAGGAFVFGDVPAGTYFLKVQAPGCDAGPARPVFVSPSLDGGVFLPSGADFQLDPLPPGVFRYHWEMDASRAGYEAAAHVDAPPQIRFLGQPVPAPDLAASDTLQARYNVNLSEEGSAWNGEYAYRLLETFGSLPQPMRRNAGEAELRPSKWVLTDLHLADDLEIDRAPGGTTVRISADAFVYASPRLVDLDGVRGRFFSKRLHHALVAFVTDQGRDLAAAERILQERFGCTTQVPDYASLTSPTTREDAGRFQPFHPTELVQLINLFEEMPEGYHAAPGLKYLVRRRDGLPHPLYPGAPAVAWARPDLFPDGSYIEFMDTAFSGDPDATHRLILHEKAHFLWGYSYSPSLKADWISLGGWYPDASDPDGWSTTKTTEFVSAYAHRHNPDEDMAESMAYYVLDPAALRSRSLAKFEFIRDRIMHGTRYVSRIRQDLTFEVLNLYPDYDYPGKIHRVDITVAGGSDVDKRATVEIALATGGNPFAGASLAYLRLYSSVNTYVDLYLYPVDPEGSVLRGTFTLSRFAKTGNWTTDQIVLMDPVGNQRFEGVHDFGWKLYVDNALEDVTPPRYVPGSLSVQRSDDTVVVQGLSHRVQRIDVRWQCLEDRAMGSVHANLANASNPEAYPIGNWGEFDASSGTAHVAFVLTEFMASGDYGVPYVFMLDQAGNTGSQSFSASPQDEPLISVPVLSPNPDTQPPEVCLNDDPGQGLHRILISARPTHPEAPNGETAVTIRYQARDDKSGLGVVAYRLLDPQGISHFQYHYHPNFYTQFFSGDPTAWAEYQIDVILPAGSPPGIWGLQELLVVDKADNVRTYSFVETVQFQVGN